MAAVALAVGTVKGLFLFKTDESGQNLCLHAHHLPGWEVSAILMRPRDGQVDLLAGTTHFAYGPVLRRSVDGGATWTQPEARPAYAAGSPFKTNRIWQLTQSNQQPPKLYAGIDEAGLFCSSDDGASWEEIKSLTDHPTRSGWQPGGGGLCLHTIIHDHSNPLRMWLGISAVGVFRTIDGGLTWTLTNTGLRSVNTGSDEPSTAYCIHKIVQHPQQPDTLFMQFHGGVYTSSDGGTTWQSRETGLPSNFGFPIVILRDGTLLIAPLNSDEKRYFLDGEAKVYRSTDAAQTWKPVCVRTGRSYSAILRDAMTTDDQHGVYFGTTSGEIAYSADAGLNWETLDLTLPRVLCTRTIATPAS